MAHHRIAADIDGENRGELFEQLPNPLLRWLSLRESLRHERERAS